MKFKSIFLLTFFLITTGVLLGFSNKTSALAVDQTCLKVESIFARGSGERVNQENAEALKFFDEIDYRLRESASLKQRKYELGTDSYGGYRYPAIAVNDNLYANAIGAVFSGGQAFAYGDSVKQGVGELKSYLTQRYNKCKSTGTQYILGGYSQGAQVVGQALPDLAREIRDNIVYVGFFGDPKLYYPEGFGPLPPACQGKNLSPWRRAASRCNLVSGSLGAHKPYLPTDMQTKAGLWCYKQDWICDWNAFGQTSGHGEYKKDGRAIDDAAREAVTKLKAKLPKTTGQSIDTTRQKGSSTNGIDTVFLIDTTGSMAGAIEQAKTFARDSADKIKAQNGRVALVGYKDRGDVYTAKIFSHFSDSYETFLAQLDTLTASGGGDTPEATLHALMTAFNGLSWRDGATKAAVVLTDAGFHNPDGVDGSTLEAVAQRSLEIDPVNVYPVVSSGNASLYQELADKTSGQVIDNTGDTVDSLTTALTKIQNRPVPLLKNADYMAAPGQEITFDASDSYVIDANITKYEWDFDGDGIFDTTSSTPMMNHTYGAVFSGVMQVRLTADNGTIANTSAVVNITPTSTVPAPPSAPKNLKNTIVSTSGNKSTVAISWSSNPNVDRWYVSINDISIGYVIGSQTSLQITDIDRSSDVIITVAGTKDDTMGQSSSTTVKAVAGSTSTPPILSTCTQSNFFVRFICKSIALLRYWLNGILYYVLPRTI